MHLDDLGEGAAEGRQPLTGNRLLITLLPLSRGIIMLAVG